MGCQGYKGYEKGELESHLSMGEGVGCRRTACNERPCFFQVKLPILWKESGEAGFLGECASCIIGWGERVLLPSVQGFIVVPWLILFVRRRHNEDIRKVGSRKCPLFYPCKYYGDLKEHARYQVW